VRSVVDGFADQLSRAGHYPEGSFQARFVTDLLRVWAQRAGLLSQQIGVTEAQADFIGHFDLGIHERQVRFAISALNWWYRGGAGAPPRAALDQAKSTLYRRLTELDDLEGSLVNCTAVQEALKSVFENHAIRAAYEAQEPLVDIIERNIDVLGEMEQQVRTQLDVTLSAWKHQVHDDVVSMVRSWEPSTRTDFLVRYICFPFWDVLKFPVQALSGVGERDAVEVARLSPRDVGLLGAAVIDEKLAGTSFHHFGAFFSRADRENDYLWGRLDAVERLVAILTDDPAIPSLSDPNISACKELFEAVLQEERDHLQTVRPLMDRLQSEVGALRVG
jgi:hypothetical protein